MVVRDKAGRGSITQRVIGVGIWVLLLLMCSCKQDSIIDEFKVVPNGYWNYGFVPTFDVKVEDKAQAYRLQVNVRLRADYRYANLFLSINQQQAGTDQQSTKRIELKLRDENGNWLGKGVGSLYTYQIAYQRNYYFPDTGTYRFEIEPDMRDNPLKGVSDIGLCIAPDGFKQ